MVVVDNGSTDKSRLAVQEWANGSQTIRLVDASMAKGAGATRNVGVEAARGELLAFCDADDVVQPGWLTAHVLALAEADASGGVVDFWSLNGRRRARPAVLCHSARHEPIRLPACGHELQPGSSATRLRGSRRLYRRSDDRRGLRPVLALTALGTSLCSEHECRGSQTGSARLQRAIEPVHRLRTVRPRPLPSVQGRRSPTRSDSRCKGVGVVSSVLATTLAARISRSLGQHRRMENSVVSWSRRDRGCFSSDGVARSQTVADSITVGAGRDPAMTIHDPRLSVPRARIAPAA